MRLENLLDRTKDDGIGRTPANAIAAIERATRDTEEAAQPRARESYEAVRCCDRRERQLARESDQGYSPFSRANSLMRRKAFFNAMFSAATWPS